MPADAKKEPKEKSKQPPSAEAAQPAAKQVTIQLPALTLDLGPGFKLKLAVLGLLVILFAFALFMFARSNFSISDAYDFPRLQYNLGKFWSVSFLLFTFLYSLSMALAVYFGVGTPKLQSAIPLVVLLVVALAISFAFPAERSAFLAFGIALGACAIAASFYNEVTLSSAWSITSKALTVLLILAFVFTLMRAGAQKDRYFDLMVGGVAAQAPDIIASVAPAGAQQAVNLCADLIDSAQVNTVLVEAAFPKTEISAAIERGGGAVYTALPASTKDAVVDSAYATSINRTVGVSNKLKADLAKTLRKVDTSRLLQSVNASQAISPSMIRRELSRMPAGKLLLDYMPVLTAFTVVGVVSILNLIIHVFATLFAWVLAKFVFQ